MINGGRMHYMRLFGFKASSVQRYFFLDNLISCCGIRNHKLILEASTESEFSESTIKYHRNCRAEFTNRRDLQTNKPDDDAATGTALRRSNRDGNQPNAAILPDQCLFCKKSKYKPNTKTREKLHSVQEFRADKTVRECSSLHVKQNTDMSEVARDMIGICAKDLISSEAKYHASCYNEGQTKVKGRVKQIVHYSLLMKPHVGTTGK